MSNIRISLTASLVALFLSTSATVLFAADKQETEKAPASAELSIDKSRAAVLIMDYQNDIVGMLPEKEQGPLLERAATVLNEARRSGMPVIYIVVRFRDGYPEINPRNKLFNGL